MKHEPWKHADMAAWEHGISNSQPQHPFSGGTAVANRESGAHRGVLLGLRGVSTEGDHHWIGQKKMVLEMGFKILSWTARRVMFPVKRLENIPDSAPSPSFRQKIVQELCSHRFDAFPRLGHFGRSKRQSIGRHGNSVFVIRLPLASIFHPGRIIFAVFVSAASNQQPTSCPPPAAQLMSWAELLM